MIRARYQGRLAEKEKENSTTAAEQMRAPSDDAVGGSSHRTRNNAYHAQRKRSNARGAVDGASYMGRHVSRNAHVNRSDMDRRRRRHGTSVEGSPPAKKFTSTHKQKAE